MAILRGRLTVPMLATSAQLARAAHGLRGGGGGAGDRQAAAGDREGDDVPAVRGRVRHGQPDRRRRRSTSATASSRGPSRCCSPAGRLERSQEPVACARGACATRAPGAPRAAGRGGPGGREEIRPVDQRDRARAGPARALPRRRPRGRGGCRSGEPAGAPPVKPAARRPRGRGGRRGGRGGGLEQRAP